MNRKSLKAINEYRALGQSNKSFLSFIQIRGNHKFHMVQSKKFAKSKYCFPFSTPITFIHIAFRAHAYDSEHMREANYVETLTREHAIEPMCVCVCVYVKERERA